MGYAEYAMSDMNRMIWFHSMQLGFLSAIALLVVIVLVAVLVFVCGHGLLRYIDETEEVYDDGDN